MPWLKHNSTDILLFFRFSLLWSFERWDLSIVVNQQSSDHRGTTPHEQTMFSVPAVPDLSTTTILSAGALLSFALYYSLFSRAYKFPKHAPKLAKQSYPIVGSLKFFTARWDFFQDEIARSETGNFSFFLGKHPVVGLSGEQSRKVFFDNRGLGFSEGYVLAYSRILE